MWGTEIFLFEERITFNWREIIFASPISLCSFEIVWFLAQVPILPKSVVIFDAEEITLPMILKVTRRQENCKTAWLCTQLQADWEANGLQPDSLCPASLNLMGMSVFLHLKGQHFLLELCKEKKLTPLVGCDVLLADITIFVYPLLHHKPWTCATCP